MASASAPSSSRVIRVVDSLDGPDLAIYRSVRDPELLRKHGVFMAESREVVRTLVLRSRFRPRSLLVTRAALAGLGDVIETLDAGTPVYVATRAAINAVVGFDIHRGCLAACDRPEGLAVQQVIGVDEPPRLALWVALAGVSNPDNIGGIFRNAAAFGACGVLLDAASADPLYRKSIRTSMGSTLTVPFAWVANWGETLTQMRRARITTVALTPGAQTVLDDVGAVEPVPERALLLFGNEGQGLPDELANAADLDLRIAMREGFDSVNVAAASAVALHHFSRAQARVRGCSRGDDTP